MIGMPVNLKEFNKKKKKKMSTFIISEYTYKLKSAKILQTLKCAPD